MIASLEVFGLLNLCWYLQKLNLKLIHSSIIIKENKLTSYILGLPQTNITGDMKANFPFYLQQISHFIFRIKMENHYCQSLKKSLRLENKISLTLTDNRNL